MSHQIVCLSCGYHRAWPTLIDALADGHRHHDAPCAPPVLPTPLPPRQDTGGDASA